MEDKNLKIDEVIFVNNAIEKNEEDLIGINEHVKTIERAIEKGASIISINSSYGAGKTSICNILSQSDKYDKISRISLWDAVIDKRSNSDIIETHKKNDEKNVNFDDDNEALHFYKAFLFKLASDYNSERYSKYVSNLLNKTTGFFSIFFKSKKILTCFIFFLIFLALYYVAFGIENINFEVLDKITMITKHLETYLNLLNIFENITFSGIFQYFVGALIILSAPVKYLFASAAIVCLTITILNGRVVYTSWKAEKLRLLTTEDVITLYTQIINDSVFYKSKKKNLIIIEDLDRNLEDKREVVYDFIRSIVKLKRYDCRDKKIKNKLNSIVLIFCIDEELLLKENDKIKRKDGEETLLKLFDYKLDLGSIHYDNFRGIFDKMIEKYDLTSEQIIELSYILKSKNNNLRLLKNEINDCFLKYKVLIDRFKNKETKININFRSCVAYSYIKNNFQEDYYNMIKDKDINQKIINLIELISVDKNTSHCMIGYNQEFRNVLIEFIKCSYIDEDFRLYFFNYPKYEKCRNIYEYSFWRFIKKQEKLNIKNNSYLTEDYIESVSNDVNRIGIEYPEEILNDTYIISKLMENKNDLKLYELFKNNFSFREEDKIKKLADFFETILVNEDNLKNFKYFMLNLFEKTLIHEKIYNNKYLNLIRKKLIMMMEEDITKFKSLFKESFSSINEEEVACLKNKSLIYELINLEKIDDQLEKILINNIEYFTHEQREEIIYKWKSNIISNEKYVLFVVKTLSDHKGYNYNILKTICNNRELLEENKEFIQYINNIVENATRENLVSLNELDVSFAINENNIKKFINNNIFMTPLTYYLYNKKYEELVQNNFSSVMMKILDLKYNYLTENIKEFKKYLCFNNVGEEYSFLFEDKKFNEKYYIDVDWLSVINLKLFMKCNINSIEKIEKYVIENNRINNSNDLLFIIEKIYNQISYTKWEGNELFIKLIKKYKSFVKEISKKSNIFEKIIDGITDTSKYRMMIYYQISADKLVQNYYTQLGNYNKKGKDDYVKYINSLNPDLLNNEVILSLKYYYRYNYKIINKLRELGDYKTVIGSCLLKKSLKQDEISIKKIDYKSLMEIYYLSEEFKKKLLKNESFIKRLIELGKIDTIEQKLIWLVLRESRYASPIFELFANNLNAENREKLLNNIDISLMSNKKGKTDESVLIDQIFNTKLKEEFFENETYNIFKNKIKTTRNKKYLESKVKKEKLNNIKVTA